MNKLKTFFQGLVIGSTMSIPGISGGTIAMILGVYGKLLSSVRDIFKKPKQTLPFLLLIAAGGVLGIFTAAKLLTMLFATPAEVPLKFAFLGAAAGCIPPMMKNSSSLPLTPKKLLLISGGAVVAAVISYLPLANAQDNVFSEFLAGLLLAAALVLPGISVSQTLAMLGMYEPVMGAIACGDIIALLPIATGGVIGTIVTARILSALLDKYNGVFLVIVGFMLFSLTQLVPEITSVFELLLGIVCCLIGAIISFLVSKKENNHDIVYKIP